MEWPTVEPSELAWVDEDTMREIDRRMIDGIGVTLVQMMENAGRSLAAVVRAEADPTSVMVLAGSGGNGGGGLAAARHLSNWGVNVLVALTSERDRLAAATAHQLAIVERMGVPVVAFDSAVSLDDYDAFVDAMVGYSLRGPLSGKAAFACERVNESKATVVSLDLPSGLAADALPVGQSVVADLTLSLCLPKVALASSPGVGRLLLADISVPPRLVEEVTGGPAAPFDRGPILALH